MLEDGVVMILSGYCLCWYEFYHWYFKIEGRDHGYNRRFQLLSSGNWVEHSRKMGCFQGGFEKLTQNYKKICCPSHSVSQEPFIMWSWFLVHMSKMIRVRSATLDHWVINQFFLTTTWENNSRGKGKSYSRKI